MLLAKPEATIEFFVYYSSKNDNILVQITLSKLKVVQYEGGKPSVLFNGKIKVKPKAWTQFLWASDESENTCLYFSGEEDKLVPCFEKPVQRPVKPAGYKIAFKCLKEECGIHDVRMDLSSPDEIQAEVKTSPDSPDP